MKFLLGGPPDVDNTILHLHVSPQAESQMGNERGLGGSSLSAIFPRWVSTSSSEKQTLNSLTNVIVSKTWVLSFTQPLCPLCQSKEIFIRMKSSHLTSKLCLLLMWNLQHVFLEVSGVHECEARKQTPERYFINLLLNYSTGRATEPKQYGKALCRGVGTEGSVPNWRGGQRHLSSTLDRGRGHLLLPLCCSGKNYHLHIRAWSLHSQMKVKAKKMGVTGCVSYPTSPLPASLQSDSDVIENWRCREKKVHRPSRPSSLEQALCRSPGGGEGRRVLSVKAVYR